MNLCLTKSSIPRPLNLLQVLHYDERNIYWLLLGWNENVQPHWPTMDKTGQTVLAKILNHWFFATWYPSSFILLNWDKSMDFIDIWPPIICLDFLPVRLFICSSWYNYACKQLWHVTVFIIRYKNTSAAISDEPMSADMNVAPFTPPVTVRTD